MAKAPKGPQVQPVPANQTNTWDDPEGHYIVRPDDIIGHKCESYRDVDLEFGSDESDKIVRLLGQGTFGKVVEARNIENRRKVAIKVIRAVQKYRDASKIEIRVLETLKRYDPTNSKYVSMFLFRQTLSLTNSHCIHMDEYFDHRNHPCIVSELYGMSVFDFLKQNSFAPFPERHIQDFAKSLLGSVDCESLFLSKVLELIVQICIGCIWCIRISSPRIFCLYPTNLDWLDQGYVPLWSDRRTHG